MRILISTIGCIIFYFTCQSQSLSNDKDTIIIGPSKYTAQVVGYFTKYYFTQDTLKNKVLNENRALRKRLKSTGYFYDDLEVDLERLIKLFLPISRISMVGKYEDGINKVINYECSFETQSLFLKNVKVIWSVKME